MEIQKKALCCVLSISLYVEIAIAGRKHKTQIKLKTMAFTITQPISGPILNRIRISAANPVTVVNPLDITEPADCRTASTIAS